MNYNKNILIVDDDTEDQEILGIVIHDIDEMIECRCVKTGEDALQTLSQIRDLQPGYIFLDLNLPFMSGFECLDAIKKNKLLQDIPVIIYSTSTRESDKQKAKELGAVSYISKPNSVMELRNVLQEFFV